MSVFPMLLVLLTAEPDFNRDVRPILAQKCFACHGADAKQRKAGLRLDRRESATLPLESKSIAIVPGNPAKSGLIRRILATDSDIVMPPPASKKSLTTLEKQILQKWIAAGARYNKHWSFQRPRKASPPAMKSKWVSNDIDRFILARLASAKMKPSPLANRVTLIRRLSFDLRGLPPSIAEVRRFLKDKSPKAYEKLVDRILSSAHYGERMAQDWLDLARYGDTNGFHADSDREMWLYRDYVIRAFNSNKRFNRFILENVAGDLLPKPTDETRVASGFNRCNTFNEEGGADPDEFYVAYAVDRANTTAQVFLGMTLGCAQCHDHKYDPLSQREFYQFYAFFNSVRGEVGAGGPTGYHNKPLPPLLKVKTAEYRRKLSKLNAQIKVLEQSRKTELARFRKKSKTEFGAALAAWESRLSGAKPEKAPSAKGIQGWWAADDINGNGKVDQQEGFAVSGRVAKWHDKSSRKRHAMATGDPKYQARSIGGRPAILLDGKRDFFRTATGGKELSGDFTMVVVARFHGLNGNQMMLMWGEEANGRRRAMWKTAGKNALSFNGYNRDVIGSRLIGTTSPHLAIVTKGSGNRIQFYLDGQAGGVGSAKLEAYSGTAITIGANNAANEKTAAAYSEVLVYDRRLSDLERQQVTRYLAGKYQLPAKDAGAPAAILAIVNTPVKKRTQAQLQQLREYFAQRVYPQTMQKLKVIDKQIAEIKKQRDAASKSVPSTLVMVEKQKRTPAFVLMRGDFQQRGEKVLPDVPAIFPRLSKKYPRNRLALAHWLSDPTHPLVARVTVNRIWKQLFGTGLVKTLGDFGTQGEAPSHQKLLDWLAVDFIEKGWNIKALQKMIVMSATYQQSSLNRRQYDEIDPNNRLLARAPRFRLSAEEVRDCALAVSGLLQRKIGGRSVKPYQPKGYYADKIGRGWAQSKGGDLYRRGVYTYWRRTTLYPTFQIFDAPSREVCTVNRPRTNTPLQALVLMNDPSFVEAARVFGQRILKKGGKTDDQRIVFAFQSAVARLPGKREMVVLRAIVREQRQVYSKDKEAAKKLIQNGEFKVASKQDAAELASWTAFGSVLLNLDETITRE